MDSVFMVCQNLFHAYLQEILGLMQIRTNHVTQTIVYSWQLMVTALGLCVEVALT